MKSLKFVMPLLLAALCGCQSGKFTHYTSPEVTGRVLAADTHQPLANATIQRDSSQNFEPFGPPKGGQLLIQNTGARTGDSGQFVLGGKSVFAIFRQPGWWSMPVVFSHSGYQSFQTNYTAVNVTSNSDIGMPIISAGDILLQLVSDKNSSAMNPQP
jgi:hypothetical protein